MAVTSDGQLPTTTLPSTTPGAVAASTIGQEFLAPLDETDFDTIERRYGMGRHSPIHDVENHVKVGALEGVDPSNSLSTLAEKTDTHDGVKYMPASRFSELTNGRPCQAVMEVLSTLLHSPQLYHRRAVLRNRLDWLDRAVVASDASHLSLTRPVTVPAGLQAAIEGETVSPADGGLKLHLAARVDGHSKQPLAATVTPPNTHETTQLAQLTEGVDDFDDLDDPIEVWDRGYVDYDRYCEKQRAGEDFVTTLKSNARTTVVDRFDEFSVTDEDGTRQVSDELIELGETGERFRRVTLVDPTDEVTDYLMTLPAGEYDLIDIVSIYTLRTLIEIFFRESKQYTNIENFHSTTLNGALFELFATLIGYLLVELCEQRDPHRGGPPAAIRTIRIRWGEKALFDYG